MKSYNKERRTFLSITAKSGLCIACSGVIGGLLSSCDSVEEGEPVIHLSQEPLLQRTGGAIRKRFAQINNGEAIFIIRENEFLFLAYSAQCTHQGVELLTPSDGTMKCPNHGSLFRTSDGSVIDGKAYDPLKKIPVSYDPGTKTITLGKTAG